MRSSRQRRARSVSPERRDLQQSSSSRDGHSQTRTSTAPGMNRKKCGDMIAKTRKALMRSIEFQASHIVAGCKISLKNFEPVKFKPSGSHSAATQNPDPQPSTSQHSAIQPAAGHDLCTFMRSYWDWLDECWTLLEAEEPAHHEYDFDTVTTTFHSRKGLRGLQGEEYYLCQKALAEHPARVPWISELNENRQFLSFNHVLQLIIL
jgi:hypothetical protein